MAGQLPPKLQEAHDLLYRDGYNLLAAPLAWKSWERSDAAPGSCTSSAGELVPPGTLVRVKVTTA
jgi:hypothetical protein